jgi:transcription factor SPT20
MVVELLDYRPQKSKEPALEKPERTCVVLHPDSATLWADICLLNQKAGNQWTDQDTLEIEARLLVSFKRHEFLDPC